MSTGGVVSQPLEKTLLLLWFYSKSSANEFRLVPSFEVLLEPKPPAGAEFQTEAPKVQ